MFCCLDSLGGGGSFGRVGGSGLVETLFWRLCGLLDGWIRLELFWGGSGVCVELNVLFWLSFEEEFAGGMGIGGWLLWLLGDDGWVVELIGELGDGLLECSGRKGGLVSRRGHLVCLFMGHG